MAEPTSMTPKAAPVVVSLSSTNAVSAALGTANSGQPNLVETMRCVATADVWLMIGLDPTAVAATAGSFLLPANVVEYIDVPAGQKIAGILASGTGSLSLMRMQKN